MPGRWKRGKKRGVFKRRKRPKKREAQSEPNNRQHALMLPLSFKNNTMLKNSLKCTLRYSEQVSINPAAGLAQAYVFSANGIYDPNITGGGAQCRGFDQIMPLYDHYHVIGSKISVATVSANDSIVCGINVRDDATASGSLRDYTEARGSNTVYGVSAPNDVLQLTNNYSEKKFFGYPVTNASTYKGTASSNPADQAYYHLFLSALSTTVDLANTSFLVTIDYIVLFTEPNDPAAS